MFCRTSTRGLRHFVSRNGQGETAPESAHHLMMKAHIARALGKAGWSVDVEVPFSEVDRIADVAATNPAGRRVASVPPSGTLAYLTHRQAVGKTSERKRKSSS